MIIDNLVKAGFPVDDIAVVNGVVRVGGDAEVSLAASVEMLEASSGKEQYRTTNVISSALTTICIDGTALTGVFSTALDLAIQNYDELPLSFAMRRAPSADCSFTITARLVPDILGASGFPSGGEPFPTIYIGTILAAVSVDTIEHVITHEIGHTIGLRHTDYFNRRISCGDEPLPPNEGDGDVGAIHIPGTPTGATLGGSIMNSCTRTSETGELTGSDVTALLALYGDMFNASTFWTTSYSDATGWAAGQQHWGTIEYPDLNGDGRDDICGRANDGIVCALSTGTAYATLTFWTNSYSDATGWATGPHLWSTIEYPDLDGDGKDDICGRANDGIVCALSTGTAFATLTFWTNSYSDATGWAAGPQYWSTIEYPDLNGDGRDDICGRANDGIVCALSTGTAFATPTLWTTSYSDATGWAAGPQLWSTIEYPDLNGDGKDDICGRANEGIACALSTGTAFATPTFWTTSYSDATGWAAGPQLWGTIKYPELDGDGRADICGRSNGGIVCALSTGTAFATLTLWTNRYSDATGWAAGPQYWGTIEYPDLDGDGRADICGRANGILCAMSNGTAFAAPMFWTASYSDATGWAAGQQHWGTIKYPDLDGDGRADICGRASDGIYCAR